MKNFTCLIVVLIGLFAGSVHAQDRCFGAAGSQCGALSGQGFEISSCFALPVPQRSACFINGGSWVHDECCFDNRQGNFCAGPASATASTCSTEMGRALSRFALGYSWTRVVDNQRSDGDGNVNRGEYCASFGKTVHRNDRQFCCNAQPAPLYVGFPLSLARPSLYLCF